MPTNILVVHNTSYIIGMNMLLLHYEVVDDDDFVLFMALQHTLCLLRLLVVVVYCSVKARGDDEKEGSINREFLSSSQIIVIRTRQGG